MFLSPKKITILIIAFLSMGVVSLFFVSFESEQNVIVEASSHKDSYSVGENIKIDITLTNLGDDSVCLSQNAQGNIKFLSFTRDGEVVEQRTVHSEFLEALSELVKADLEEVAPGDNMTIDIKSSNDPGLGSETLHTSQVDGIAATTTFYSIEEPGNYEVIVAYEYPGEPSDTCPNVFEGETNTAIVEFMVN
ncbi:MAG: methane monooxygenase/ammonia monooxygenase subunit B [Candidatus Spechtbacterales bacterium]|nr:methane monooxygenase/ammonia monooxygenase subunit B [Candidatus Spechtbacterales bacterium]